MQAGTLPLPVPALEERKRIQDIVKWEALGEWGAGGGVWEDVPTLRRVFQLLLIGRKGEEGSKGEGWRKVEHDPVCQIQWVSCSQGQRQWDVYPWDGDLEGLKVQAGSVWRGRDGEGGLRTGSLLGVLARVR